MVLFAECFKLGAREMLQIKWFRNGVWEFELPKAVESSVKHKLKGQADFIGSICPMMMQKYKIYPIMAQSLSSS